MKYIISLLLLTIFCWQPVMAQSDTEITDSISSDWGEDIGGGGLNPIIPYYDLIYMLDGVEYKRMSVAVGSTITPLDVPAKEGHTFSGWSGLPETMPAKNVIVTGSFVTNGYTLTYIVDGKKYRTRIVAYGVTITAEAEPTKVGHTFSGWSEIPETMPAEDVTVTGSFTVNKYQLIYVVDGEEYHTDSIAYGTSLTVIEAPTREGHTFNGWSGLPKTMPAKDVTVTGIYKTNVYKITFTLDGEVFKTANMYYGDVIPNLVSKVPQKIGYTFAGWSEIPETMPAHDVTVTGSYTVNKYMLTYIVDGEEYHTDSIAYGTALTVIEVPVREGHTFSGWSVLPETMPAKDVTVYGSYKPNVYKITFILDGEVYKTANWKYGDVIPNLVPTDPRKTGYTFSGWSEIPETMPAHDITIIGTFIVNKYLITYVVDGEVYRTDSIAYGTTLTAIDAPAKEGHTFAGWTGVLATMPAKDVTVTGLFTANSYKVTYILDGEIFKTETVTYGTAIPTPEVPAKEGYNFSGWGEIPATMPAKDLTFTGSYTINKDLKYNIIYMVDGTEYKRVTIDFGDAIILETAPTKEGHTFSGWSEVPETMPLHDVTVIGTFTANSYTLTYMLDGETFKTETVTYGTTISTPEAPVKEGHTFAGWTNVPVTMPAKDVTVTGGYSINKYTLTYMVDGTVYKVSELEYGAIVTAEAVPTKEGHTFSGWNEIPATMPAKDVTVTGTFVVNTYTVVYKVDGEIYATEEVVYGETIVLKEEPVKEGYLFSGWSEIPETMPAKDIEVTGHFDADGIDAVLADQLVDVYTQQGVMLKRQISIDELRNGLSRGIYIINGKKVIVH